MDEQQSPTVIDRRELLRRGALVGGAGALAWAAPSVTTFGARAFAAGTLHPGTVSWVMVWFTDNENKYYRVKYESTDTGYSSDPSAENTNSILKGAFGAEAKSYVEKDETSLGALPDDGQGRIFTAAIPIGTSASANSNGFLQLAITNEEIKVWGWLLHDGSCNDGVDKIRSADSPYIIKDDSASGLVGPPRSDLPTSGGEDFLWKKCL